MSIVKNSPKSYAIFVRSSYGDLLMTDPLIKYIKKLNSQNIITLFVEDKNYQLAEFMENIDHIYSMPSKGNKYFYFVYYGLKYRQNKYDISIAAKTGVGSSNGFFPFILGAATKIAYVPESRRWTDWLVNKPVLFKEDIYHQQHYALGVLQLLEHKFDKIPEYLYPKLNHLNKLTKKKLKPGF